MFLLRQVAALLCVVPLIACAPARPIPHNRMPDASLLLACKSAPLPPANPTDNDVGVFIIDQDVAFKTCAKEKQLLVDFVKAGEPKS